MITDKISALFQFIDFLHSSIENFKQYDELINELYLLDKERSKLSPQKNFADKLKYDEIQAEIKEKLNEIDKNIIQIIKSKVSELNICDWDVITNLWNYHISEIINLKENFSKDDIPEILKHKSKYLEFRTETNCTYFQDLFFDDLDEILKELFDFFPESKQNEFEVFETKTIQVKSIREAVEQFQNGSKKASIQYNSFENQTTKNEPIDWFKIFETIDIDTPFKPEFYITDNLEQQRNYFSNASFKLTLQYLLELKKQTYLFSGSRKLDYINSLNIEKPKVVNTENPLFNQTVFEAQSNYYDFIIAYKSVLETVLPLQQSPFSVLEWATIFYYADETK